MAEQFGGSGKGGGWQKPEWDGIVATEEDAIREIYQQLQKPPHNKVYFDNWRQRFPDLGPTYKDYMLSRPDLVELTFEGNRYSVTWVGEDLPELPKKRAAPPQAKG